MTCTSFFKLWTLLILKQLSVIFLILWQPLLLKKNSPQHLFLIVEIIIIYKNSNWYLFNYKNQ